LAEETAVLPAEIPSTGPNQPGLVLATLIVVAAVANLPLAMANVALPSIGAYFDASQTELNLVAVGYSLGLACSVLWFGALGDRYGRKMILLTGVVLAMPAALIAGFAPSVQVLIAARIFGGMAAGMAFPTCLALIAALWGGPARTRSIALWAATGGAINACGPLLSGLLLTRFPWSAVFFVVIPVAVVALIMALKFVPAHVKESTEPVDNLGGLLSLVLVGTLILAINFAPVPNMGKLVLSLTAVAVVALILFVSRQRRASNPLYDLEVAARPTFWAAAVAGIIVFGSLMGAMFIGQQFMQNVLGYSTVSAGAAILPAAICMILVAPRSARLVHERGSRFTLLLSFASVLIAFVIMLLLWKESIPYWKVALGYIFLGIGVGLGGTPSSNSLTASVPVTRVGMASGTADLQRDLGGALMQSIFGALLAMGFATAMGAAITASPEGAQATAGVTSQLEMSYASAETIAAQYPQYATQITAAAKTSFLAGDQYAYIAGIIAVLLGIVLVFFKFPKRGAEMTMVAGFHAQDMAAMDVAASQPATAPAAANTR
jgi:MFS transporter, DHA2 family, multidrug resistance protein